jgi:hypothetical protein
MRTEPPPSLPSARGRARRDLRGRPAARAAGRARGPVGFALRTEAASVVGPPVFGVAVLPSRTPPARRSRTTIPASAGKARVVPRAERGATLRPREVLDRERDNQRAAGEPGTAESSARRGEGVPVVTVTNASSSGSMLRCAQIRSTTRGREAAAGDEIAQRPRLDRTDRT